MIFPQIMTKKFLTFVKIFPVHFRTECPVYNKNSYKQLSITLLTNENGEI